MPHNLIEAKTISKKEVAEIMALAEELRTSKVSNPTNTDKIGGLLFFEPSTRTRIGFEVAAIKLGCKLVTVKETKFKDTMTEPESITDTIKTFNPLLDFFLIRHPEDNVFKQITPYANKSIINCGNGYNEHPTQALINLYTIWHKLGRLDNFTITFIGDVKYSRAAHSFIKLLSYFKGITINEVAPSELGMQEDEVRGFELNGNRYKRLDQSVWGKEDVVYSTGFPPRNPSGEYSQEIRDKYKITVEIADKLSRDCIVLNDLPRIDEIDQDVDDLDCAYYFKQNELGLFVRMAILKKYCLES